VLSFNRIAMRRAPGVASCRIPIQLAHHQRLPIDPRAPCWSRVTSRCSATPTEGTNRRARARRRRRLQRRCSPRSTSPASCRPLSRRSTARSDSSRRVRDNEPASVHVILALRRRAWTAACRRSWRPLDSRRTSDSHEVLRDGLGLGSVGIAHP
jgi:hypothetical protein